MFKSSFGRGLVAAMENIDNAPGADEVIPAADSAETSLLETTEAGAEVTGTLDDIESATADADSLGAIAETMESTEETGGLDPVAAQVAEVAVESICARLGVQRRRPYAMESFGDKSRRVGATRYAVEEIKGVLGRVWDAIIVAFGKVKEFLKNFFKALFDSNEKLAQRADALVNKATNATGAPKEKEIAAGGFGKALATGGAFKKSAVIEGVSGMPAWLNSTRTAVTQKPSFADKLKEMVSDAKVFDGYQLAAFKQDGFKASSSEGGLAHFAASTGVDFAQYDLDEPIVYGQGNAIQSAVQAAQQQGLTTRRKLLEQFSQQPQQESRIDLGRLMHQAAGIEQVDAPAAIRIGPQNIFQLQRRFAKQRLGALLFEGRQAAQQGL